VINNIEGVRESSVVGIDDRTWGEKVVAAVVPEPGKRLEPDAMKAFCEKRLHNWKCPKEVALVDELPRNSTGKVVKEKVKRFFQSADMSQP